MKPILIIGLPGSGKTTLALELKQRINAVHWNADAVRQNINKDLHFTKEDREEQARRMGWLCQTVTSANYPVIADFVCPTEECRTAFGPAFVIWVNRIKEGRFPDTNKIWVDPLQYDIKIGNGLTIDQEIRIVLAKLHADKK